jgi:phage-related protein
VFAALAVAAGCGSSSSSKSTTTTESAASARAQYANDLCGALVTWKSAVKSVATQLKSGNDRSKAALSSAAGQVESATKTLADSLEGLGTPPTPAAQQVKGDVNQLSQQLSSGADKLKTETADISGAQGVVTAISAAGATVSSMANDVSATLTQLKSVDAKGTWKSAFSQAASCQTLSG